MKRKKILVTGGAGYIGSHLVRKLLERGYRVNVLDNLSYGGSGIEGILGEKNLNFIEGDICCVKDVVKAVQGTSRVIALAAIVGDPACELNREDTISTNYQATKILVEVAKYYRVERIIFASSCSVYGANSKLILNEGSQLQPLSLYAETRIMSEQVLLESCENVVPVILRLATVFGFSRRMRFDLVVNILSAKAAMEKRIQVYGGSQWRPFVHVKDAADAFILAAEAPGEQVNREIINVGSNSLNFRIKDLAGIVKKVLKGTRIEMKPEIEDSRDYRVGFDKIGSTLGFKPRYKIEHGVREIARFLERRKINYKDDIYYNVRYLYV